MQTASDVGINNQALWQQLLIDSNQDGFIDGVTACFVPLQTDVPRALWAALANVAARLGLEAPAIHLPIVCGKDAVQPWQCPLFFSWGEAATVPQPWTAATDQPALLDEPALRIIQVVRGEQTGFQIHGSDAAAVIKWLTQLATATTAEIRPASIPQGSPQPLDLAHLFKGEKPGLFAAGHDGFMPDDTAVQLVLGLACSAEVGAAAVDLAARIGLETTGITLPLAVASDELPAAEATQQLIAIGFPDTPPAQLVTQPSNAIYRLDGSMCHYLAEVYPFLNSSAQRAGNEAQTVQGILDQLRAITHAHTPLAKLALAEVQAGRSLHLLAPGSPAAEQLQRVIFRQAWSPADGLDDRRRVYKRFIDQVLPHLQQQPRGETSVTVTLFCNAPAPARKRLAAACREQLRDQETVVQLQVLPVHKAGLTWLLEEQLPQLQQHEVAQVIITFAAFRPPSDADKWLDLPTRWLQELFPADELLAQRIGLPLHQVTVEMIPMVDRTTAELATTPTYRVAARNHDGQVVHTDELYLLWSERLYMAGLPQFGLVHPTTGGVVLQTAEGVRRAWPTPTDDALFWDFYQTSVLPALRSHVIAGSGGRPTPAREPYFDRLEVALTVGAPDEPLGIYEEFISLGEALHEDIYFNTLDYLAALGEAFAGESITAAGQVVPWVRDYYQADGEPVSVAGPRATVTLYDWAIPCRLPDSGLTVGDPRDMPTPVATRVAGLTVDAGGTAIRELRVELTYADAKRAHFAANVLQQWHTLAGGQSGFPVGVALTIDCCAGAEAVATVAMTAATADATAQAEPAVTPAVGVDSAIIGPQQLEEELAALAQLPGIRVWQVGRSYQGRPGHVVDVTLPVEAHQTHIARHKLTLQKPTLFFVARHHANEVSSTTSVLQMARDAVTEPLCREWLSKVNLVLLPMANPDGAAIHYALMAEHPRWKHHAARFNAAGKEFGSDHFNENTPFGEARFRRGIWERWLPDAIVDNHGVPSHEWCQPFAGYTTPPRFPVCYHVVQAMLYGIITYADDPAQPQLQQSAAALRAAVAQAVAATPWLYDRNQYWLNHYRRYGHQWLPDLSPVDLHNNMLFFYRGVGPDQLPAARRNFAMRYPQITLLDWVTEVPDETAQGDYLTECAAAHRVANEAMIQLLAESAAPVERVVEDRGDGQVWIGLRRERRVGSICS